MASIFIVEDELAIAKLYEMLLSTKGFKILGLAKNGEEAVEIFKTFNEKPDIILMDHRMPVKDGIQASKEILEIDPNAKIIFASADNSVRDEAKLIGALCFKSKPFSNEKLIENIQKALKNSRVSIIS